MRYLTNSLLILILLLSVVLTGCYKYKFMETIYIDDIYTQEEDEYLIYFYTEDCYYCKKSYDTIQEYLNYQEENDSIKLYVCNLSEEENKSIKRSYEGTGGQGSEGQYFVNAVSDPKDLYISGVPSLILINEQRFSKFVVSGRSKIIDYFTELMNNNI